MKTIFLISYILFLSIGSLARASNADAAAKCNPKDLVKLIDLNGQLLSTSLELQGIDMKHLEYPKKQGLKVSEFRTNLKTPEKLKLQKQWAEGLEQFVNFLKQHPECETEKSKLANKAE